MVLIQWTLAGHVYLGKEKILEDKDSSFILPNSLKDLECAQESAKFKEELLENLM